MPRHSEATLAAIKQAVDIVALVGDYLPLHRSGSKFKALCPFHNDHNPSLELNPERQSFKCWSCGAGGDIFDFVQAYERVEFPEALRMLAERAGVALDSPAATSSSPGASKTELLAVNAWAERVFAEALARSPEALAYVERRGLSPESVARFRLGFAPDVRDWLAVQGRRAGFGTALLERAGLVARSPESPRLTRDRFRGRLIFPIHDLRGRPIGFGGRILPEVETEAGRNRPRRREVSEHARDAPVPEAADALRGRPGPARGPARPAGSPSSRGTPTSSPPIRSAWPTSSAPWARPWATTTSWPCGAWPTASSWSSTATRPARRPPTGRWSCSWGTRWTCGC